MIAEIIINTNAKSLNQTYDYIVPDSMKEIIKIGSRVFVPFGRKKQEEGFVISFKQFSEFANKEINENYDYLLSFRFEDLNNNNIKYDYSHKKNTIH